MNKEEIQKIKNVFEQSLANLDNNKPFDHDTLYQGCQDTLEIVSRIHPVIGDLCYDNFNNFTDSEDDFPLSDIEYNDAIRRWLEYMIRLMDKHL